jgi:hypothetical protein
VVTTRRIAFDPKKDRRVLEGGKNGAFESLVLAVEDRDVSKLLLFLRREKIPVAVERRLYMPFFNPIVRILHPSGSSLLLSLLRERRQ